MANHKIGIGTVQFGVDYGISNRLGRPAIEEIQKMLSWAREAGVCYLDTAPSYGDSEARLGESLPIDHSFKVVTKTPTFSKHQAITPEQQQLVTLTLEESLRKLKMTSVYGVLIHHVEDLLKPGGALIWAALQECQTQGAIQKIGVSVYTADQIDWVLKNWDIELIQLPLNVFDQRLLKSGHLNALKKRGVEIHVRSVFLQGLLLMNPQEIPSWFNPVLPHIEQYHLFLKERGVSPLQAALGFVSNLSEVDSLICGVVNLQQLQGLLLPTPDLSSIPWQAFALTDPQFVNPSQWRIGS
ncbi:aldo/keto reductase [Deltaproteobacteria bacterium TL4]